MVMQNPTINTSGDPLVRSVHNLNRSLQNETQRATKDQCIGSPHTNTLQPVITQVTLGIRAKRMSEFIDLQVAPVIVEEMKGHPWFVLVPGIA